MAGAEFVLVRIATVTLLDRPCAEDELEGATLTLDRIVLDDCATFELETATLELEILILLDETICDELTAVDELEDMGS